MAGSKEESIVVVVVVYVVYVVYVDSEEGLMQILPCGALC